MNVVSDKWRVASAGFLLILFCAQAGVVTRLPETDPVALPMVEGVIDGSQALEGIRLDRSISSWDEIGITFENAVRLNAGVTVSNDAVWTGWSTTGDLLPEDVIFLTEGEVLESPVQVSGVARFEVSAFSGGNATAWTAAVFEGTNSVSVPYRGTNGVLRITAGETMPGMEAGLYVESVELTGYTDADEAAAAKTVSGLRVIEAPEAAESVTPRWFVDEQDAADRVYADAAVSAYAADPSKTVAADRMILGNYSLVGSGAWRGANFLPTADGASIGTRFDEEIITLDSGLSVVEIQGISEAGGTVTLQLYAQNIVGEPTIHVTDDLVGGEWTEAVAVITELGDGFFSAAIDVSGSGPSGFFRAFGVRDPAGTAAVTIHSEQLLVAGKVVFTNGWSIQCTTNGLEFVAP